MIDNNDNNTDDFDKLLNDFIREELGDMENDISCSNEDEDQTIPDYYSFNLYKSRGVEYRIPECHKETFCKMRYEIILSIDGVNPKNVPQDGSIFFTHDSLKNKCINVAINHINSYTTNDRLVITLYKEGISEPLFCKVLNSETCQSPIKIKCDRKEYSFGSYFLLVSGAKTITEDSCATMGGNMRFNFTILQHGESHENATINNISLKKDDRTHGSTTSAPVKLEVEFDRKQTSDEVFTFCCTTGDYKNMAPPIKFRPRNNGSKKIKVSILTSNIWVQETYHIYSLQNGEPSHRATFKYDGKEFTLIESKKTDKNSNEYLFMKYLLIGEDEYLWDKLSNFPGVRSAKEIAISNLRIKIANKIRSDHGLRAIHTPQNYIVEFMNDDFLKCFIPLATPRSTFEKADCSLLVEPKNTMGDPYEESSDFIESCKFRAMVLYNIGALLTPNSGIVLDRIGKWLASNASNTLILCGSEAECRAVIETIPFMQKLFPKENIVRHEQYTLAEQVHCLQKILADYEYFTDGESEQAIVEMFVNARKNGDAIRWRYKDIENLFKESIYPRIVERIINYDDTEKQRIKNIGSIQARDLNIRIDSNTESEFSLATSELNNMVGLNDLKEHFEQLFSYMRMESMRREMGLTTTSQAPHHMIFTGNPGTGKTTVAKKIGKIFHALGLLSKGEVIVTERTKLVGRYIGETEHNMQRVLEQARGNVLFIDEAYTLCNCSDDRKDFGRHVIDALLTVLALPNPDMIVIMAGYKNDMERMMNANLGLEGRFPHKFHFADYSEDELMQIATAMLAKNEYCIEEEANETLRKGIKEAFAEKSSRFSNARWVEQVVMQGMLPAMSSRIMKSNLVASKETLTTIKNEDVIAALDKFKTTSGNVNHRCSIGFSM